MDHWLTSSVKVAHVSKPEKGTGATAFLFEKALTSAAYLCGSAPATREVATLTQGNSIEVSHGLLIGGGSAFGLDGCAGLLRRQKEKGIGVHAGKDIVVPVCPAACIFDLKSAASTAITADEIYDACVVAGPIDETLCGLYGVGTGATVSKLFSNGEEGYLCSNGGMAFASIGPNPQNIFLTVFVVCNAVGDIYDEFRKPITGPKKDGYMYTTNELLGKDSPMESFNELRNSTIAAIFTNVTLNRSALYRLCKVAASGLSRSIQPIFTLLDGDIIFAFSTNMCILSSPLIEIQLGEWAGECVEKAIRKAIRASN